MQVEQLGAWVDARASEIENWLETLVNINTFTANTEGVDAGMDKMCELTDEMGFTVEAINSRHRLVKAGEGTRKPRILLISHMDTVFPPDGDFLEYKRIDDELVTGPGVGDIKGGLLIGLYAMKAVAELLPDCDVQMIVSANEEIGSPTIRDWFMGENIDADYAIGLEPGFPQGPLTADVPLGVVYQRRGYSAMEATIYGKEAHSGVPHEGISAIVGLAERILKINALNAPEKGISTNVGVVSGGTAGNTLAATAKALVSFRYETMADGEATKAAVEEIITAPTVYNKHLDIWDRGEFEVQIFTPPMERNERNQYLVDTVLAEAERLGHNVVPIARGGGSDANYISAGGTPSICGMGAPCVGLHSANEVIHLPMMIRRVELLAATLYRLLTAE